MQTLSIAVNYISRKTAMQFTYLQRVEKVKIHALILICKLRLLYIILWVQRSGQKWCTNNGASWASFFVCASHFDFVCDDWSLNRHKATQILFGQIMKFNSQLTSPRTQKRELDVEMCHLRFLPVFWRGWLNMWRANRPSSIDYMESRDINLEVVKKNQKPKQNILDNYWCVQYGYMSLTYIDVHRRGFLTSLCIIWKIWISHEFCWWNMGILTRLHRANFHSQPFNTWH